jgi:hypothetical protein
LVSTKVMVKPQNKALHSMLRIIFLGDAPKAVATTVPMMGLKRMGVRKAMPRMPKRCQMRTMRRLFLLKMGFCFKRHRSTYQREKKLPIPEKMTTLVIIPVMVSAMVAPKDKPMETPANGPPKNLTMLKRNTETYLKISAATIPFIYSSTIQSSNQSPKVYYYASILFRAQVNLPFSGNTNSKRESNLGAKSQIPGISQPRHNIKLFIQPLIQGPEPDMGLG